MQTKYFSFYFVGLPETSASENVTAEETAAICRGHGSVINKEKFDLFEMMFNMDKGACTVAQENLENSKQKQKAGEKEQTQSGRASKDGERQDKTRKDQKGTKTGGSDAPNSCPPPDTSKTGLAPWQEGVLERLGQQLTPQEYNMYMVHHGRMLLTFGQIEACTPREKDFVYGSLEPVPVQTLRSFKVRPFSWI